MVKEYIGWEKESPAFYNFSGSSIIQAAFGFMDGALNAFPKKGFLFQCGVNLKAQRVEILLLVEELENRNLIEIVDRAYNTLGYVYNINYYCYYGFE